MDLFVAFVVMLLCGVAGLGIGVWWDRLAHKHNWKGWYFE